MLEIRSDFDSEPNVTMPSDGISAYATPTAIIKLEIKIHRFTKVSFFIAHLQEQVAAVGSHSDSAHQEVAAFALEVLAVSALAVSVVR